jgi:hypothetical protein
MPGVPGVTCPLLVWERTGHIFGSECVNDSWTVPFEVAHSLAWDANPEAICFTGEFSLGPWIVWQSNRDGDTAIFGTSLDSVGSARRWCDSGSVGANVNPAGIPAAFPAFGWEPRAEVWVSNRNGNPDIYSSIDNDGHDILVDGNPALDSNPELTLNGAKMWCCWQSNRSGNWNICGSYIYETGVEESRPATGLNPPAGNGIVRGVLELPGGSDFPVAKSRGLETSPTFLLDISGRKVMELHPGQNDVSRFGAGVYFVRGLGSGTGGRGEVRKVVITR